MGIMNQEQTKQNKGLIVWGSMSWAQEINSLVPGPKVWRKKGRQGEKQKSRNHSVKLHFYPRLPRGAPNMPLIIHCILLSSVSTGFLSLSLSISLCHFLAPSLTDTQAHVHVHRHYPQYFFLYKSHTLCHTSPSVSMTHPAAKRQTKHPPQVLRLHILLQRWRFTEGAHR